MIHTKNQFQRYFALAIILIATLIFTLPSLAYAETYVDGSYSSNGYNSPTAYGQTTSSNIDDNTSSTSSTSDQQSQNDNSSTVTNTTDGPTTGTGQNTSKAEVTATNSADIIPTAYKLASVLIIVLLFIFIKWRTKKAH